MGRFETELLSTDENVEALVDMNGVWIDKVHDRHPPKMIILDWPRTTWENLNRNAQPVAFITARVLFDSCSRITL